jgi:hypothetical protein
MMQWRDTEIIPRYNQVGVPIRLHRQPELPGPDGRGRRRARPRGRANFPTGWFTTREAACQWLAS